LGLDAAVIESVVVDFFFDPESAQQQRQKLTKTNKKPLPIDFIYFLRL